jgi:hypothetical protein
MELAGRASSGGVMLYAFGFERVGEPAVGARAGWL